MARNLWQNPFILHECQVHGVDRAPIDTNIFETYGQCNEDLIVEAILRAQLLRAGRAPQSIRYAELGANHPIQTSSTYLFYRVYGAQGVLAEPNPALAGALRKVRPRDVIAECAVSASSSETIELYVHDKNELSSVSVDHIARFENYGGTEKIQAKITCKNMHINDFMRAYNLYNLDYLSIDLEGLDLEVVAAMDRVFQPMIVQCEHEGKFAGFTEAMSARGYGLLAVTDVNAMFVRSNTI